MPDRPSRTPRPARQWRDFPQLVPGGRYEHGIVFTKGGNGRRASSGEGVLEQVLSSAAVLVGMGPLVGRPEATLRGAMLEVTHKKVVTWPAVGGGAGAPDRRG